MLRIIVLLTIVSVFAPAPGLGQESATKTNPVADQLLQIAERLIQHSRDLNDMARPHLRNCDAMTDFTDLQTAASLAREHVMAVQSLLWMHSLISTPLDRARVQTVLILTVAMYRQSLETEIKTVNSTLGRSSIPPALAVLGIGLRDDIRAATDALKQDYWR